MAKSALITGITGQDGSYLAELLLDHVVSRFGPGRCDDAGRSALGVEDLGAIERRQHRGGGFSGDETIDFGDRALRLPAKRAGEASVHVIGRFAAEREAGEAFGTWLERVGGAGAFKTELAKLDEFPTPEEAPDFYVDYDETGPYSAEVGEGECAAT